MKLNLNRGLGIPFFLVHSSITFRNFSEHFSLKKCVEERGEEQRGQVTEIDLLKARRLDVGRAVMDTPESPTGGELGVAASLAGGRRR